MPWVRFADDYLTNSKVKDLSPLACWLDVAGVLYSARELRDGQLSLRDVQTLAIQARLRQWRPLAAELCAAGRWLRNTDGSYSIHDYFEYQPSRETVLRDRSQSAERQSKYRARHAGRNTVTDSVTTSVSNSYPVPGPGIKSMSTRQKQQPEHARTRETALSPELQAEHQRRLEQERAAAAPAAGSISFNETNGAHEA